MRVDAVEHAARLLGPRARPTVPLGPLTTYRVGGPAALFAEADDEVALAAAATAVAGSGVEVLVVGKGSNLLVADAGFAGLALVLGDAFATIEIPDEIGAGEILVRAGGAAALPVLARRTASAGLTGMEWAVGVPGSVGGGVRMNAGGHGSDMAAVTRRVRVVDLSSGEDGVVPADALGLGYRRSSLAPSQIVVWAEVGLVAGDAERSAAEIAEIVRWRRENQPGGQNAGSVFANPPGMSAGQLIDAAGCKGLRRGSAVVSTRHANFIQADTGGTAADVAALMAEVQRRVAAATGVELRPENRLVGFEPGPDVPRTLE